MFRHKRIGTDTLKKIRELKESDDDDGLNKATNLLYGIHFESVLTLLIWANIDELIEIAEELE